MDLLKPIYISLVVENNRIGNNNNSTSQSNLHTNLLNHTSNANHNNSQSSLHTTNHENGINVNDSEKEKEKDITKLIVESLSLKKHIISDNITSESIISIIKDINNKYNAEKLIDSDSKVNEVESNEVELKNGLVDKMEVDENPIIIFTAIKSNIDIKLLQDNNVNIDFNIVVQHNNQKEKDQNKNLSVYNKYIYYNDEDDNYIDLLQSELNSIISTNAENILLYRDYINTPIKVPIADESNSFYLYDKLMENVVDEAVTIPLLLFSYIEQVEFSINNESLNEEDSRIEVNNIIASLPKSQIDSSNNRSSFVASINDYVQRSSLLAHISVQNVNYNDNIALTKWFEEGQQRIISLTQFPGDSKSLINSYSIQENEKRKADWTAQLTHTDMNPAIYNQALLCQDFESILDEIAAEHAEDSKNTGNLSKTKDWKIRNRNYREDYSDSALRQLFSSMALTDNCTRVRTLYAEERLKSLIAIYRPTPLSREFSDSWSYQFPTKVSKEDFIANANEGRKKLYYYDFESNLLIGNKCLFPSDRALLISRTTEGGDMHVSVQINDVIASLHKNHEEGLLNVGLADGTVASADIKNGMRLSYTLPSGVVVSSLKSGCITFQQSNKDRHSTRNEYFRSVLVSGVVSVDGHEGKYFMHPDGTLAIKTDSGLKFIDRNGHVSTHSDEGVETGEDLQIAEMIDPETRVRVITRNDYFMFLIYPDGSTLAQFPDGTRIFRDVTPGGMPTNYDRKTLQSFDGNQLPLFHMIRITVPGLPVIQIRRPDADADITIKPQLCKMWTISAYFDANTIESPDLVFLSPHSLSWSSSGRQFLSVDDGYVMTDDSNAVWIPQRKELDHVEDFLLTHQFESDPAAGTFLFHLGKDIETVLEIAASTSAVEDDASAEVIVENPEAVEPVVEENTEEALTEKVEDSTHESAPQIVISKSIPFVRSVDPEANSFTLFLNGDCKIILARDSYNVVPDSADSDYIPAHYYSPLEDPLPPRLFVLDYECKNGMVSKIIGFELLTSEDVDFFGRTNNRLPNCFQPLSLEGVINPTPLPEVYANNSKTKQWFMKIARPTCYAWNVKVSSVARMMGNHKLGNGLGAYLGNLESRWAKMNEFNERTRYSLHRFLIELPELTIDAQQHAVKNRDSYLAWIEAQLTKDHFYSQNSVSDEKLASEMKLVEEFLEMKKREGQEEIERKKRSSMNRYNSGPVPPYGPGSIASLITPLLLPNSEKPKLKDMNKSESKPEFFADKTQMAKFKAIETLKKILFPDFEPSKIPDVSQLSAAEVALVTPLLSSLHHFFDSFSTGVKRKVDTAGSLFQNLRNQPLFPNFLRDLGYENSQSKLIFLTKLADADFFQIFNAVKVEFVRIKGSFKNPVAKTDPFAKDFDVDSSDDEDNLASPNISVGSIDGFDDDEEEDEETFNRSKNIKQKVNVLSPHRPYLSTNPMLSKSVQLQKESVLQAQLDRAKETTNRIDQSLSNSGEFVVHSKFDQDAILLKSTADRSRTQSRGFVEPNTRYIQTELDLKQKSRIKTLSTLNIEKRLENNTLSVTDGLDPATSTAFPEFSLTPSLADFGNMKLGCTYRLLLTLTNLGHEKGRFQLPQPEPSKMACKILYKPGPVAAGISVKLELELFAGQTGPFESSIVVNTERSIFNIPLRGNVLLEIPEGNKSSINKVGEPRLISTTPSLFTKGIYKQLDCKLPWIESAAPEVDDEDKTSSQDQEDEEAFEKQLSNEIFQKTAEPKLPDMTTKHYIDSLISVTDLKKKVLGTSTPVDK